MKTAMFIFLAVVVHFLDYLEKDINVDNQVCRNNNSFSLSSVVFVIFGTVNMRKFELN